MSPFNREMQIRILRDVPPVERLLYHCGTGGELYFNMDKGQDYAKLHGRLTSVNNIGINSRTLQKQARIVGYFNASAALIEYEFLYVPSVAISDY